MKTENLTYKNIVHTLWLNSINEDKYINMSAWFIHYIKRKQILLVSANNKQIPNKAMSPTRF